MYKLNIIGDGLIIKDLAPEQLPYILTWYNDFDGYAFATGNRIPISLYDIERQYEETINDENNFFAGIFNEYDRLIGIMKGTVNMGQGNKAWIRSLIIHKEFQNRGLGTKAIEMFFNFLARLNTNKEVYLSVLERNEKAREFWKKNGFFDIREFEREGLAKQIRENIIIMSRKI